MVNGKVYLVDEKVGEYLKTLRRVASSGGEVEIGGQNVRVTRKHVIDLDDDQYTLYDIKDILGDQIDNDIALFIMKQPKVLQEQLLRIKKQREHEFPYKAAFANIEHVQSFIDMIHSGCEF